MRRDVPAHARELAARLSLLFVADSRLAERANDAQRRLLSANDRLWSGWHPDALDGDRVVAGRGVSALAGSTMAALGTGGGQRAAESALLGALAQTRWTIHRAFCDYQSACEERRRLAVSVGELSARLSEALIAAGWSEEAARDANVHELAAGRR